MLTENQTGLELWHRFVVEQDVALLEDLVADNAVFHSPVAFTPKTGKAEVILYLSNAVKVLQNFEYHRQFEAGSAVALEFSASVADKTVKGIDLIEFDPAGKIVDFEVMVRPMSGLQVLWQEMGKLVTK